MNDDMPIRGEVAEEDEDKPIEDRYAEIIEYKKNEMKINLVLDLPETDE